MEKISKKISETLKNMRQQKGWSLDVTSKETGVSKSMLGQIERGESSPTIATLWKIATGFQTSFSSFIEGPMIKTKKPIRRRGKLERMHPEDNKIRVSTLFRYDKKTQFEVFTIELAPGCEHLSPPHDTGVVEHIMPIQGTVEILENGTWHPVSQGEAFRFHANQPHGYRNRTNETVIIHDIIYYEHTK